MLFPSPRDRPDPGIEPRSPALQADALTSEPPGKPSLTREARIYIGEKIVAAKKSKRKQEKERRKANRVENSGNSKFDC